MIKEKVTLWSVEVTYKDDRLRDGSGTILTEGKARKAQQKESLELWAMSFEQEQPLRC